MAELTALPISSQLIPQPNVGQRDGLLAIAQQQDRKLLALSKHTFRVNQTVSEKANHRRRPARLP